VCAAMPIMALHWGRTHGCARTALVCGTSRRRSWCCIWGASTGAPVRIGIKRSDRAIIPHITQSKHYSNINRHHHEDHFARGEWPGRHDIGAGVSRGRARSGRSKPHHTSSALAQRCMGWGDGRAMGSGVRRGRSGDQPGGAQRQLPLHRCKSPSDQGIASAFDHGGRSTPIAMMQPTTRQRGSSAVLSRTHQIPGALVSMWPAHGRPPQRLLLPHIPVRYYYAPQW
jgi:hypothetical protein